MEGKVEMLLASSVWDANAFVWHGGPDFLLALCPHVSLGALPFYSHHCQVPAASQFGSCFLQKAQCLLLTLQFIFKQQGLTKEIISHNYSFSFLFFANE